MSTSVARRARSSAARLPSMTKPRAEAATSSRPRRACVSKSNSSPTRSRSPSRPSGRISSSQSIAHLFAIGEPAGEAGRVAGVHQLLEFIESMGEAVEGGQYGLAVFEEDRRPQMRVAGGDAGDIAEAAGGERQPVARRDARHRRRHGM